MVCAPTTRDPVLIQDSGVLSLQVLRWVEEITSQPLSSAMMGSRNVFGQAGRHHEKQGANQVSPHVSSPNLQNDHLCSRLDVCHAVFQEDVSWCFCCLPAEGRKSKSLRRMQSHLNSIAGSRLTRGLIVFHPRRPSCHPDMLLQVTSRSR
jgi:hypothetical protein